MMTMELTVEWMELINDSRTVKINLGCKSLSGGHWQWSNVLGWLADNGNGFDNDGDDDDSCDDSDHDSGYDDGDDSDDGISDDSEQVRVLAGVEFTRRGVARPTNNGGRLCR